MRKLRTPNRMALELASALAAALLVASAASAANAPRTISSDICDYASNKPLQLQNELNALMLSLGFTGLPPDQCDKFVKNLVASCLEVVKSATQCSLDVNAAVGLDAGRMSDIGCSALTNKDDMNSCRKTVKTNTKNNRTIAGQTVQLLGANTCNRTFALFMHDLCIEGATPP
jgi:hypothetical protein